jgi:hypothetical protein
VAGLTACEIKAEGPAVQPPPVDSFSDKVTGPEISGTWTSGCEYNLIHSNYQVLTLTFNGRNLVREETTYADNLCSQNQGAQTWKGKYRFNKTNDKGSFELEYTFDLGNGVTQTNLFENVQLKNGILYISELHRDYEPTTALLPPVTAITSHEPAVGQKISFVSLAKGVNQEELYTIQAYNVSQNDWTVSQEIKQGTQSKSENLYLRDMWSTTKFKNLMKYCESQGHSREVIKVPAGTFETCKMKKGDSFYWYGNVPVIGVVRIEASNGEYRAELKSLN